MYIFKNIKMYIFKNIKCIYLMYTLIHILINLICKHYIFITVFVNKI